MLNSSISTKTFLVSTCMKKAYVKRIIGLCNRRKINLVYVRLSVIIIITVTRKAAHIDTIIFFLPMINRKQNKFLFNTPGIGKSCDERTIDHIPKLIIILLFLIDY